MDNFYTRTAEPVRTVNDRQQGRCLPSRKPVTIPESRSYLYKLTASGNIPHSKPNGKMIFFEKRKLVSSSKMFLTFEAFYLHANAF